MDFNKIFQEKIVEMHHSLPGYEILCIAAKFSTGEKTQTVSAISEDPFSSLSMITALLGALLNGIVKKCEGELSYKDLLEEINKAVYELLDKESHNIRTEKCRVTQG